MGKRVIISEGQYDRIFLNEQKLPGANAGEIQQFLIDNGVLPPYRIVKGKKYSNKDWDFGDGTAKAFAKYYGLTNIKTVKQLHNKLNSDGYNVGNRVGFGTDMAQVLSDLIKEREGELPDLNKRFFYSEDGKSGISSVLSDSQIDKYWGTNNDWKYWVKRNGGMGKHLQGLRKSYNGASDKPGYIKVLMVSEYGLDWIYDGKITSNKGGTPIFWTYVLEEEREKEKKEEEEEKEIDRIESEKRKIRGKYVQKVEFNNKTKTWTIPDVSSPEPYNDKNVTNYWGMSPMNNSSVMKFDPGVISGFFNGLSTIGWDKWKVQLGAKNGSKGIIDFKPYINNFNNDKKHWSKVNTLFGWGNRSATIINDTFIKHHPFDTEKSDEWFGNFQMYLDDEKTRLLSPQWIIKESWDIYKNYYKSEPEYWMRNMWVEKTLEEKGYNRNTSWSTMPKDIRTTVLKFIKENPTPVENLLHGYIQLLDFIDNWNGRFKTQKIGDYYLCDGIVYSSGAIGALFSGPAKFKHANWKQFCRKSYNYGGNWIYNDESSKDTHGNKGYLKGCGCVNTPDMDIVNINTPFDTFFENPSKNIYLSDTRDFKYKAMDFIKDCDWHCWVDIVALVALFVACPFTYGGTCVSGVALAGAMEIAHGIYYVVAQEDGWKMNAGLQFISAFSFGLGRIGKLSKSIKIGKYNKIYSGIINNSMKNYSLKEWKLLAKEERDILMQKSFKESTKDMSAAQVKEIMNLNNIVMEVATSKEMKSFMKQMEGLSSVHKAEFNKMLKSAEKNVAVREYIQKSFKAEVGFKTIIKNYTKYVPSKTLIGIQAALFAAMYIYDEETADLILSGMKGVEDITGIEVRKMLGVSTDINPNDDETKTLQEKLKHFIGYSTLLIEVENYLKENIYTVLQKYNISPSKKIEDIIVNGYDSIIGKPLENVLERLETIVEIIQRMEGENKTESEIKEKLEYLYNEEINYLEQEGKKDNIIKDIRDANKANPITDENKKWMEENGINIDTEVWDINLLEIE
jgi:hypothetical protein